ncbi:hypothetical protein Taro_013988 [Colocasia esculenta]|uniref:Bowman-Birk serine protease inhibitors family domain-containing protein n=1 Tax=Colocasia esculenta TaxID=4460 RepID=A0A843UDG3_COLES|nr:hypothetical protein [Colocasia esculenta]
MKPSGKRWPRPGYKTGVSHAGKEQFPVEQRREPNTAEMKKASRAVVLLVSLLLVSFLTADVSAKNCCVACPCTRSIPPQCRCLDVDTTCYTGCKRCVCTRSIPPQCRCTDVKSYCPKRCPTSLAGLV